MRCYAWIGSLDQRASVNKKRMQLSRLEPHLHQAFSTLCRRTDCCKCFCMYLIPIAVVHISEVETMRLVPCQQLTQYNEERFALVLHVNAKVNFSTLSHSISVQRSLLVDCDHRLTKYTHVPADRMLRGLLSKNIRTAPANIRILPLNFPISSHSFREWQLQISISR